ncbi:MAG: hypothetical protein KDN22_24570 [Verrucomicrobiae bacterium]|nr:hypothetical protein [Verrucomicrobiae bacterium]
MKRVEVPRLARRLENLSVPFVGKLISRVEVEVYQRRGRLTLIACAVSQ